jgi:uncharacterized protein
MSEITREARNWAMICHLSGFALYLLPPFGQVVAPLLIWLLKREASAYIDEQGREAVNFQISITLYMILAFFLIIFLIGVPLVLMVLLIHAILMVIAAIRASEGAAYRYPFTIRFIN